MPPGCLLGAILRVYAFALSWGTVEFTVPRQAGLLVYPYCYIFFPVEVSLYRHPGTSTSLEDSMTSNSTPRACRRLLAGLSVVIAVVLISSFALAQSDAPNPKWDIFAGYQYLDPGSIAPAPGSTPSSPSQINLPGMAKGIGGALTYNFDRHFGFEGDAGYNRGTSAGDASSEWTVGGGPRFIVRTDSMAIFIHALGTFNRVTTDNGFITSNGIGVILGGGLDIPFGKKFAWRLFGADYVFALHNFANYAPPETSQLRRPEFNGARLRTGVVMNWGGAPELV